MPARLGGQARGRPVLPVASVLDTALGWWNDAWLVFAVLGVIALGLVQVWTACSATVARQVTNATVNR